jgi:hypothetical protein
VNTSNPQIIEVAPRRGVLHAVVGSQHRFPLDGKPQYFEVRAISKGGPQLDRPKPCCISHAQVFETEAERDAHCGDGGTHCVAYWSDEPITFRREVLGVTKDVHTVWGLLQTAS